MGISEGVKSMRPFTGIFVLEFKGIIYIFKAALRNQALDFSQV